jgi:hypothetical protein
MRSVLEEGLLELQVEYRHADEQLQNCHRRAVLGMPERREYVSLVLPATKFAHMFRGRCNDDVSDKLGPTLATATPLHGMSSGQGYQLLARTSDWSGGIPAWMHRQRSPRDRESFSYPPLSPATPGRRHHLRDDSDH